MTITNKIHNQRDRIHAEMMVYPEVQFPKETSLHWSSMDAQCTTIAAMANLILLVHPPRRSAMIHYEETLKNGYRPRTNCPTLSPQLNWRLLKIVPNFTTKLKFATTQTF